MSYDLQLYKHLMVKQAFIDTEDEAVATEIIRQAADDNIDHVYVLSYHEDDYTSEPTHVLIDDVLYKLVEVDEPEFVPTDDQIDEMVETGICLECGAEIDMCGHAEKFGIAIEVEEDEDGDSDR